MKVIPKYILSFALFASAFVQLSAQTPKTITTRFFVAGICQTCKETIESALDVKGVINASYDLEKHEVEVSYKTEKITLERLHALLHEVGYDTSVGAATDEQYAKVHHCCKYRENGDHKP